MSNVAKKHEDPDPWTPLGSGSELPGMQNPFDLMFGGRSGGLPFPVSSGPASNTLPSSQIPGLHTAVPPALPTSAVYGAGAGVPFASDLLRNAANRWFDPRTIAGLAAAGGSALSGLRQPAGQDQLRELFALAMERSRQAGPLFDQLMRMTQAQLPAYTRGE